MINLTNMWVNKVVFYKIKKNTGIYDYPAYRDIIYAFYLMMITVSYYEGQVFCGVHEFVYCIPKKCAYARKIGM